MNHNEEIDLKNKIENYNKQKLIETEFHYLEEKDIEIWNVIKIKKKSIN